MSMHNEEQRRIERERRRRDKRERSRGEGGGVRGKVGEKEEG